MYALGVSLVVWMMMVGVGVVRSVVVQGSVRRYEGWVVVVGWMMVQVLVVVVKQEEDKVVVVVVVVVEEEG